MKRLKKQRLAEVHGIQPGGLADGSRRSQHSGDLRSCAHTLKHPGGVPGLSQSDTRISVSAAFWHPSGMRIAWASFPGGLRCAATSGYRLETLRVSETGRTCRQVLNPNLHPILNLKRFLVVGPVEIKRVVTIKIKSEIKKERSGER